MFIPSQRLSRNAFPTEPEPTLQHSTANAKVANGFEKPRGAERCIVCSLAAAPPNEFEDSHKLARLSVGLGCHLSKRKV